MGFKLSKLKKTIQVVIEGASSTSMLFTAKDGVTESQFNTTISNIKYCRSSAKAIINHLIKHDLYDLDSSVNLNDNVLRITCTANGEIGGVNIKRCVAGYPVIDSEVHMGRFSSNYLSDKDVELLSLYSNEPTKAILRTLEDDHGFVVFCDKHDDIDHVGKELLKDKLSTEFIEILMFAIEAGMSAVNFDENGLQHPMFPMDR